MWPVTFTIAITLLAYIYVGYPLILHLFSRFFPKIVEPDADYLPHVSLIVAAYNEETVIEEKILNLLELDYPRDKLEIIIASDGSDDHTNEIVKKYENKGVKLNEIFPRGGKTRALNLTIPKAKNEILILSDANAMYRKDSIKEMVKYLKDKSVGGITGDVRILNDSEEFGKSEGLYYKYERHIQNCESRIASIIGVDGAMYALKKEAFLAPSDDIILDDFVTSMNIVRLGYRVLYNPEAIAFENATPSINQEINRRIRITAGGMQALLKGEGLPRYFQIKEWIMYLSHKLLRWFSSIFLILLFISNLFLLGNSIFNILFLLQVIFYSLALIGLLFSKRRLYPLFKIPFYFCMVNYAALIGLFKGITRMQKVTWKKADREIVNLPNN